VTQSPVAIVGIVVSFSLIPAALIGLSLWTLVRYPLRREDIEADEVAEAAGDSAGSPA
jgi:Na+/melibiose symporter-like transporter